MHASNGNIVSHKKRRCFSKLLTSWLRPFGQKHRYAAQENYRGAIEKNVRQYHVHRMALTASINDKAACERCKNHK